MNSHDETGQRALNIALKLWPRLHPIAVGSIEDRNGCDAVMPNGERVQVKGDARVARSGLLCWEFFKKVHEHPEGRWYHSPSDAQVYIFVTEGAAYWVSVDTLAVAAIGKPLKKISPTCLCFLIPWEEVIPPGTRKEHALWGIRVML